MTTDITPAELAAIRESVEAVGPDWYYHAQTMRLIAAVESARSQLAEERERVKRFKTGMVRVDLDGGVYFEPYVKLLRDEIDSLRTSAQDHNGEEAK